MNLIKLRKICNEKKNSNLEKMLIFKTINKYGKNKE